MDKVEETYIESCCDPKYARFGCRVNRGVSAR